MAYEVTATRKRPQTFEQIVGQDFFVSTLRASIEKGKIAHAYLFSGPRGVGKTSAARILAKSLNCEKGPTENPCGECSNCVEITQGNSLDVIEIDGASNTSVNDVREIKDEVLFSPNSSRYKVYIIDEVHMLSNSAFNALLKTIEEPPPYVIFIFATTAVHKVPATIKSRCQQFVFRLISVEQIKEKLAEAAEEEGTSAEEEALFWIAKEATGSLRDAYTLFDQVSSFSEGNITIGLIKDKLGTVGLDGINEIAELLVEGKIKEALSKQDDALNRGVSVEQLVIDLAEYYRCILFIQHGSERESLLGYKKERFSGKVLEALNDVQIERGLEIIFKLYRDLRYSLNQRFELELALSRLSTLGSYVTRNDILNKVVRLKAEIAGGSSAEVETPVAGKAAVEDESQEPGNTDNACEDTTGAGVELKDEIISAVRKKYLSLASSLEKVESWRIEDETFVLTCNSNYASAHIKRESKKVQEVASSVLGRPYKIILEKNQSAEDKAQSAEESEEKVEMIRRVFKGEIVDNAKENGRDNA